MRVLATPQTALARQIWESVRIDKMSGDKEACLNLKSELGQSWTPGLQNRNWRPPGRQPKEDEKEKRREREEEKEEEKEISLPQPPRKKRCPGRKEER